MSTRTTWMYVAVSIALLLGYVYTGTLERKREIAAFESRLLFDFEPSSVTRLSIDTHEDKRFEATRLDDAQWVLSAPYAHVTPNSPVWEELTKVITRLSNEMIIEASPEDLSVYGLEDPPLKVEIETDAQQVIQLNMGDLDPTQNNRYAQRIGEDTVFLIPTQMVQYLYRSLKDVRDVWVFPGVDYYSIDRMEYLKYSVDDPDDTLEAIEGIEEIYVLDEDKRWGITNPAPVRAYHEKVENMVVNTLNLRGDGYIDSPETLEDYGLQPAWGKVTLIDSASGMRRTLRLGWIDDMAEDGRMFATIEGIPSVFTIDAAYLSFLPQVSNEFRERRLFSKEAKHIKSIQYKDTKQAFTLDLDKEAGWQLTDPAVEDTDVATVSAYINLVVLRMVGTDFVDATDRTELDSARITLSFDFSDGSPSTTIAIGGPVPGSEPPMVYARQDFGALITIPFRAYQFLHATPYTFRNKHLFEFEQAAVTQVSMDLEGTHYALKRDFGEWSVQEPQGYQVESQSDLEALLKTLNGYTAINIADPTPEASITGVESPLFAVTVHYVTPYDPDATKSLRVGQLISPQARHRFSWVDGREETFYVDHGFIEDIRRGIQGIRPVQ